MSTINKEDLFEEGSHLSILEHLNELRIRLTWSAGALLVTTIASFFFTDELLSLLLSPYGKTLITTSPTESIETFFKVSLLAGAVMAMPIMLHQLWLFIAPGLTKDEKKYVYFFVPSGFLLFLIGLSFSWFILVPAATNFLSTFQSQTFDDLWRSEEYISFILKMLFWMGLSFEMPVISYFVSRVGLLSARTLAGQWRFAVVGVAVLAAAITPSIDPITMLLTMAPLLVLYFFSIGTSYIGYRQFERKMAVD